MSRWSDFPIWWPIGAIRWVRQIWWSLCSRTQVIRYAVHWLVQISWHQFELWCEQQTLCYHKPTRWFFTTANRSGININILVHIQYGQFSQMTVLIDILALLQVFVLMQFDPGLEYKPPAVRAPPGGRSANTQGSGVGGGGSNKDDNSWLLLCSALTDGPYSYIWTMEKTIVYKITHLWHITIGKFIRKFQLIIYERLRKQ